MPIKAVFSDLDGTLLGSDHRISDYTAKVLHRLRDSGVCFIVATGRPYMDVFATLETCGLMPDYIITSNGARVHDREHRVVFKHDIDPAVVRELVAITQNPDAEGNIHDRCPPKRFATNVYRGPEWLTDVRIAAAAAAFHPSFQCVELKDEMSRLPIEQLHDVHEMWFMGKHEDIVPLNQFFVKRFGRALNYTFAQPFILDCVHAAVSKGNAVKEVSALLGVDLADVACFGDGMNDKTMLEVAGHAFITSNGQQRLKDEVPTATVIDSNANDGVAKQIEKLCFSN